MRVSTNISFYTSFVPLRLYFRYNFLLFIWFLSDSNFILFLNLDKFMIYIWLFLRFILPEGIPLNSNIWGYLRPLWHINVDQPTIKSSYTSTIISSTPKYQDQSSHIKGSFLLRLWYRTLSTWWFFNLLNIQFPF